MRETIDCSSLLSTASGDGRALLAAAARGWEHPVPHCPEWDAAGLVGHTGGVFEWMAAIVTSGDRVSRRTLDRPPADPAELVAWYVAALGRTVDVLGASDPDAQVWTFSASGDRRVAWWCRRLAVEVALHRHDAEHAVSDDGGLAPATLNGEVAAAGIEEFIVEFLPGLLSRDGVRGLDGTLKLQAIDVPLEWWVDLDDPRAAKKVQHAEADTALRASRSDLLLWLTNRASEGAVEVIGKQGVNANWVQLAR